MRARPSALPRQARTAACGALESDTAVGASDRVGAKSKPERSRNDVIALALVEAGVELDEERARVG